MPDYINQELLRRRLAGLGATFGVPQVSPEEEPIAAQVTPQQPMPALSPLPVAPTTRTIAPSGVEQEYAAHLQSQPSKDPTAPGYQERYAHPGKIARLAAILSGVGAGIRRGGGAEVTRSMLAAPFEEATSEWERKRKALEPLAEMEHRRAQLGQTQFGTEAELYKTSLQGLNSQELNIIRQQQADQVKRMNDEALKYQGTGTQMEQFHLKQAQLATNELAKIDRTLAGQKEVTGITTKSAEARAEADRLSRERVAGAGRASAERMAREARTLKREQFEPRRPFTLLPEDIKEQKVAEDLVRQHPEWAEFVDVGKTRAFLPDVKPKIKSATEIPKGKEAQYQKFMSALQEKMGVESYSVEYLDEDEQE